jgi:hypothetical protein
VALLDSKWRGTLRDRWRTYERNKEKGVQRIVKMRTMQQKFVTPVLDHNNVKA